MTERPDPRGQVRALLARGWRVSDDDPNVFVHPVYRDWVVRFDPVTGDLRVSLAPAPSTAPAAEYTIPLFPTWGSTFWWMG
jgi:hypothetical protein